MKKYILPFLALALLVSCNSKKDQEVEVSKAPTEAAQDTAAQTVTVEVDAAPETAAPSPGLVTAQTANYSTPGFNVFLTGSIGICREAQLTVNVGEGTVMLAAQERNVRFKSYDSNTHQLIYEAFYEGEYIGDYVGTYADGSYKGVFTNIKNGGKVNFDLRDFED